MNGTEGNLNLNYGTHTYHCSMCLWAEQCACDQTCDDYTPLDLDIDLLIEAARADYRCSFAEYADADAAATGDWGYSYRKD